jgi:hypothetical protein
VCACARVLFDVDGAALGDRSRSAAEVSMFCLGIMMVRRAERPAVHGALALCLDRLCRVISERWNRCRSGGSAGAVGWGGAEGMGFTLSFAVPRTGSRNNCWSPRYGSGGGFRLTDEMNHPGS